MFLLIGVFPLHDPPSNYALYSHWRRYPFLPLPSHQLKEYIGEKLGLYFVFLDFYTKALLWLCVGALPFQIAAWSQGDSRGEGDSGKVAGGGAYMAGYALILACWAIAFHQVSDTYCRNCPFAQYCLSYSCLVLKMFSTGFVTRSALHFDGE
ncbi:hypothetical protein EON65_20070 [archaeon]|nr:MAG: hypothetical protein EON65_20070 [archaeon]